MSAHSPARPFGRLPAAPPEPQPRRFALGALGLGAVVGAGLLLTAWGGTATYYLLYSDDIAGRAIAHQRRMQIEYEEHLGALRAKLEQVASQKVVEQQQVETRVNAIAIRQTELETRNQVLSTLLGKGSPAMAADRRSVVEASATAFAPIAKPASDPLGLRLRDTAEPNGEAKPRVLDAPAKTLPDRLSRLEHSLTIAGLNQVQLLRSLTQSSSRKAARYRTILAEAGLNPNDLGLGGTKAGMGGPLVPLPLAAGTVPFEAELGFAKDGVAQLERLRDAVSALPLGRPTQAELDVTSGFGPRIDPFTRSWAQHTGIDFRVDYGSPVRATGAGEVVSAGPSGGYGNMVEIDHGHGVTTRYAHLSGISVREGQSIQAGAIVGRAGSSGRSTGTHLHYETRVDGNAIDAQRFLKAGQRLKTAELD